jgi:hypothetical protein
MGDIVLPQILLLPKRHFWEKWEIHMRSRDISGKSGRYT